MKRLMVISALALALVGVVSSKALAWSSLPGGYCYWDCGNHDNYCFWNCDYNPRDYYPGDDDGGTPHPTKVPEPSSLLLLGSGLVGLWAINRKRS